MVNEIKKDKEDRLGDGNGVRMYLIMVVWYFNAILMCVVLMNWIIALVFQIYE